ncbi:FG-GAP repeat protein [Nannocystis radixulma]|uniref:FG-GAP repeat protein n=1 Tax=Nannocystis radixulma TaxID=2995305 RepID=A0ABT5BP44_9BACT|nr:FG-GAP repeat protein [Nannocystis radixulma]MDC0675299.1 FG-GAP repeat protein [Nannocystis radixulma]
MKRGRLSAQAAADLPAGIRLDPHASADPLQARAQRLKAIDAVGLAERLPGEVEHRGNPMPPWFGDFNGDGRTDLVFGLPISAYFNPGVYFLESAP